VERPVVLGHSWGAQVAMALGLDHPESVGALVLLSGYWTPSLRMDVPWMSLRAVPVLGWLLRHTVSPVLARAMWPLAARRLFTPGEVTPAFRQRYPVWMSLRAQALRASAAESALMIPAAVSLGRRYGELRVPTVIAAGRHDRLLSTRWHSERLHRQIPASRLRLMENAGHMVHHTATAEVMSCIDEAAHMAGIDQPKAGLRQAPAGLRVRTTAMG
jgi:pimeloyl-ACP methyl ester carboxylesterase